MTAAAFDTISRLDVGLPVTPADLAVLEIAERHASDDWYRLEQRMHPPVCVVDGVTPVEREGDECTSCHLDAEIAVVRAVDL
jgi:hypothetical protein